MCVGVVVGDDIGVDWKEYPRRFGGDGKYRVIAAKLGDLIWEGYHWVEVLSETVEESYAVRVEKMVLSLWMAVSCALPGD